VTERRLLLLNLVLLVSVGLLGVSQRGKGNTPFGSVAADLAAMEERLMSRVEALSTQIEGCTVERYRQNLCAPGESPLDLTVTVCGDLGAEAGIEGKYAVEAKASGQAGVGWKAAIDADVKVEAAIPVPIPVGPPQIPLFVILPTEVAVGAAGRGGVGIEGCLDGVRAPLAAFLSREQILAILDRLEAGAEQLAVAMAGLTGVGPGAEAQLASADPGGLLDTKRLADAVDAARSFRGVEFQGEDPLSVFTGAEVAQLRGVLPTAAFAERLLMDPGAAFSRLDPLDPEICAALAELPAMAGRLDPLCDFTDGAPRFVELLDTLDRVSTIDQRIQDLPDVIRFVVEEALPELPAPQPVLPPTSGFCTRFPRLCIFQ
jgi:hypothetical protein